MQPSTVLEVRPCWFACYTRGRHEKQVDRLLRQRGIESYLPVVQQEHQWKDRKKSVAVVLYPSYVFARVPLIDLCHVLATPGVASVVRNNGRPVEIESGELENVRRFVHLLSARSVEPRVFPLPERGDRVHIVSGPFQGIDGIVVERRRRCRVLVGLEVIGWGAEVEVEGAMLEPVARGTARTARLEPSALRSAAK